ncbi:hypothetical protein ABFT80_15395 [Mesorhizobium sp. SB112]
MRELSGRDNFEIFGL